jgi:hypothetical protein
LGFPSSSNCENNVIAHATLIGTTVTVAVSVALADCVLSNALTPRAVTVLTSLVHRSTLAITHEVDAPGARLVAKLQPLRFKSGSLTVTFTNGTSGLGLRTVIR